MSVPLFARRYYLPAADLPALEQRLEARLLELERLYEARPRMSDALGRAGAGQRIDELLEDDDSAAGDFSGDVA